MAKLERVDSLNKVTCLQINKRFPQTCEQKAAGFSYSNWKLRLPRCLMALSSSRKRALGQWGEIFIPTSEKFVWIRIQRAVKRIIRRSLLLNNFPCQKLFVLHAIYHSNKSGKFQLQMPLKGKSLRSQIDVEHSKTSSLTNDWWTADIQISLLCSNACS